MKICNVISENADKLNKKITDRCYVVDSVDNIENDLPTLIVGWKKTKDNYPDASILTKKIKDNLYWTFSSLEKRKISTEDIDSFLNHSYEDFTSNIKYWSLDPVIHGISESKVYLEKLKNLQGGYGYLYKNRIIYVYKDMNIYSIDLDLLDFIGFSREEVMVELEEGLEVLEASHNRFKKHVGYIERKYIPYFIYKDETQNITIS